MKNIRLFVILSSIIVLLSIPLIAMNFTDEVDWTASDFIIMGILLTITGLLVEFTLRKVKNMRARAILCASVLVIFFITWAELAVGIFGSPFAGS